MPKCEAHNMIEKELDRVKNNQSELYGLDRERQQDIARMQSDLTEIKTEQKMMKNDISELKKSMSALEEDVNLVKTKQIEQDQKMSSIENYTKNTNQSLKTLQETINQKKWQPKDYCVIIVAILSLIGTIVTSLLK